MLLEVREQLVGVNATLSFFQHMGPGETDLGRQTRLYGRCSGSELLPWLKFGFLFCFAFFKAGFLGVALTVLGLAL